MTVQPTRDQLREAANAATPGPWEDGVDDLTDMVNVHHDGEYRLWVADCGAKDDPHARADAEFIAAARTAVPQLLDQLDGAEHRIARLEAQTSIRGRAVIMYRERAREAEARIKAVQHLIDQADEAGDWTVTCSRLQWAIDGEVV